MLPSEGGGVPCDLHRIHENFRHSLGLFGVRTHGDQAYSLDKQHLRRVPTLLDVSLYSLFGLLDKILRTFVVNVDILALAINYTVGSEGFQNSGSLLFALDESAHEGVVGDLESLEPSPITAQYGPYRGDGLADAVADRSVAFWN